WRAGASTACRQAAIMAILLLCLAEQINTIPGGLPRSQALAALSAVPPPLKRCDSFLVAVPDGLVSPRDHNDALWISLKTGLPTLNGASGWWPPGWRLDDASFGYLVAARAWIKMSKPPGQVCLYDRQSRRWSLFQTAS